MSRLTEPVGPKPKNVYLRRRLLVLAGVILVPTIIVLLLVFRPGGSGGVTEAKEVQVPTDLGSTPKPTQTVKPEDLPGCKKSDLEVFAVVNANAFDPGVNPEISMTITNTGKKACVVDLGTKELSYEITSGSEVYWRSTDCQVEPTSSEGVLEPSKPQAVAPLAWNRTRSAPDTCEGDRPVVPGGGATYKLSATANGVTSEKPAPFILY